MRTRARDVVAVLAIAALAFNLRPAAVSIGPVLDEITGSLAMSPTAAGLLTTLPLLAFACFGAMASGLAHAAGVHRVALVSVLLIAVGIAARSATDSVPVFLGTSALALAGMATANVLLPSLVRLHFPQRVGLLTGVYTTSMAVGLTLGSAVTVPVALYVGSWRAGLAVWAATALLAALPWLALVRRDSVLEPATVTVSLRAVARTRLGWAMALFFGLQSLQAYAIFGWFATVFRDAGFSATTAGYLLGVITGVGVPLSFWVPTLAGRRHDQTSLIVALSACYPVGYLGLIFAPVAGAWVWAALIGAGTSVFPLILTLIGLRARTAEGTAALSGFTQSTGYLIAAVGPFGIGVLYELTGGWTVALTVLLVLVVGQLVAGLAVARPSYVEDQLRVTG